MRPALYPVLFRRPLRGGPTLDLNFTSGTLDSRVTYSGASLATLTDATGAIAYKPHNLLTYSEAFDNAAWAKVSATVTANSVASPDGSTTADTLVEGAVTAAHFITQAATVVSGSVNTFSVWAKAGARTQVHLEVSLGFAAIFNLSTQAITPAVYGSGVVDSTSITAYPNGWYRLTLTGHNASGTAANCIIATASGGSASYAGDGTSGVYIWGSQLNIGPLQPYYPTTSAAYYGPRFTYDPVTHAALGLLIEEQRTNLMRYSEAFDNAAWAGGSVTVALAAGTAPNGTTTLNKLTANSTANTSHQRYQIGLTLVSGNKYTGCAWMRQAEYSVGIINIYDTTTGNCLTYFNLATGAVMTLGAGCTATCTAYPGGIYLCTVTRTVAAASGGLSVEFSNADNTPAFAAAIGSGIYAWGAQLEAGAFATSYIPTTSAFVTRAADSATMTGANFSSWFNATQGTFAIQWSGVSAATPACGLMSVNDGTSSNKMDMRAAGGQTVCAAGGALQWAMSSGAGNVVAGKGAFSYATNAGNFCMNGLTVQNDASVTVPSANKIQIGALDGVATNQPNGAIARLRYYNTALTNAQLQALTT